MLRSLAYFSSVLRKDFAEFCNHQLQLIGLSYGLLFFILYIKKHPACSPGELSSKLHFDTGHTSRSLDKLEQSGFVLRCKNEEDKRAFALHLTPKGEEAFALSHQLFLEWDNEVMNGLCAEEKKELLALLTKVAHCRKPSPYTPDTSLSIESV